ncbi:hypothetical protein [Cobetia amphilecti]|uniref:hypothetical protein n=1 Tax=Cobetia amphilecti TaxID=1055104 RepID=UPI003299BB83
MDERSAKVYIQLIQTAGKLLTYLFVTCCIYFSIKELAGKVTIADIATNLSYSNGTNTALVIYAAVATCWALFERKHRESKIKYLSGRIKGFETGIDPQRTSSGLTATGNTRPGD